MQRKVGHWCNTGAEKKVNIEGADWMEMFLEGGISMAILVM